MSELKKIIIDFLGPERSITVNNCRHTDGDIIETDEFTADKLVNELHYASYYSEETEAKIKKSLEYADRKRAEIQEKVQKGGK